MTKRKKIEIELYNKAQFLKKTNNKDNEIYKFSSYECPNLMNEVGILRELSFGKIGGGTGKKMDIDEYDSCFDQLIIWNPEEKAIIGGYRIQKMKILPFDSSPLYHFFEFSPEFVDEYAPETVELGRSFIIPEYQATRKGIYSLDNLFDGIGAWIAKDPSIKYLVGKITLYPQDLNGNKKDLSVVYEAIDRYFNCDSGLLVPRENFKINKHVINVSENLSGDLKKDLNLLIRKFNAPPLLSVYAGLSPSMKTFGTIFHRDFGGAEETALMINMDDVYPNIKERYNL